MIRSIYNETTRRIAQNVTTDSLKRTPDYLIHETRLIRNYKKYAQIFAKSSSNADVSIGKIRASVDSFNGTLLIKKKPFFMSIEKVQSKINEVLSILQPENLAKETHSAKVSFSPAKSRDFSQEALRISAKTKQGDNVIFIGSNVAYK